MNLKILAGPSLLEISKCLTKLDQGKIFQLRFRVSGAHGLRTFPDVTIRVKKMQINAKKEDKLKFRFMGRTESGSGDKCMVSYRPLGKSKGIISILD